LPRDHDAELPVPVPLPHGDRVTGEQLFQMEQGLSDTIVEVGLPCSRAYDGDAELWRIRRTWASEAAGFRASRPRPASFRHRSLRRV
jgi:hypothetical protein